MASPITFSGLASGIDSASLIDALVKSAQTPVTKLQTSKTANSSQSTKITDIRTKLTALQTAAQAIDTKRETLTNASTSSDEKVLKVTALGGAAMGNYKVKVTSLAQAERTYSDPVTASDKAGEFGTGTISIKVGSAAAVDVQVTGSDTLLSVADKINSAGSGVSAGVVSDGKGGFRLQINGTQAGEKNGITFTENGTTLGLAKPENERPASDATIEIDDIEIKSSSNTVTGAVPGVTLNLVDVGTSVVKIDRDNEGLKTKLQTFVKSYNDVMSTLNSAFAYSGTTKGADSLAGDSTMKQLQSTLRSLVGKKASNGDSDYTLLSQVGLSMGRDGTLSLDESKLTTAINKDFDGVSSLFAGRVDGAGMMKQISDGLTQYTKADGSLKVKIDNLASRNKRIDQQITSMQTRIDKYRENLEKQYAALEQTIAGLNSQGSSLSSML